MDLSNIACNRLRLLPRLRFVTVSDNLAGSLNDMACAGCAIVAVDSCGDTSLIAYLPPDDNGVEPT